MKHDLGYAGQHAVVEWLGANGFTVRTCNFTTRYGEIDLIAQKDDVIAFIEVKTRRRRHFDLSLVITRTKQNRIIRSAQQYILSQGIVDMVFRFDIALVHQEEGRFTIEYLPNAFQGDEII